MKNYKKYLILFFVLFFGIAFWNFRFKTLSQDIPNEITIKTFKANLAVDNGEFIKNFDISGFVGKSALEATEKSMETKVSGEGKSAFVTSIEGRTASAIKREFWELIINGKSSDVGAGSYIIQNGDKIEWHLSNY